MEISEILFNGEAKRIQNEKVTGKMNFNQRNEMAKTVNAPTIRAKTSCGTRKYQKEKYTPS
jgi:hypothetical protein